MLATQEMASIVFDICRTAGASAMIVHSLDGRFLLRQLLREAGGHERRNFRHDCPSR